MTFPLSDHLQGVLNSLPTRPGCYIMKDVDGKIIYVGKAITLRKFTVTRQMNALDGSRYFGPYTSVWAVHQTLALLRKIFGYLTCDRIITGHDPRACLYFDIKLCIAPCIGAASKEEYRAMIDD